MIFTIILIVLALVFIYFLFQLSRSKKVVLKAFKRGNVIVFGAKGKGKDLLFQWVINQRKKPYLANLSYGGKYEHIDIKKDLDINISYDDLILGDFETVEKNEKLEGKDIFISDAGVYFPSSQDSKLHKCYKSFPLVYNTQRHLYNSNIFSNCQWLSQLWKALREHSDAYIKCKGAIKLPFIIIVKFTYFEKYSTAENDILKMKKPIFESKEHKALREQFEATHGVIQNGIIVLRKKTINYDTRAFHQIIFGSRYEN